MLGGGEPGKNQFNNTDQKTSAGAVADDQRNDSMERAASSPIANLVCSDDHSAGYPASKTRGTRD